VYAVNGHVFALVTRPAIGRSAGSEVVIESVALGDDPLKAQAGGGVSGVPHRLLPASYLRHLEEGGPMRVGDWAVLPPTEAYLVAEAEGDRVVVAAAEHGRILLASAGGREDSPERFFVVDPGEAPEALEAPSFVEALLERGGSDPGGSS
jgi:hypothetical protein